MIANFIQNPNMDTTDKSKLLLITLKNIAWFRVYANASRLNQSLDIDLLFIWKYVLMDSQI